jgi:hypothetical protein
MTARDLEAPKKRQQCGLLLRIQSEPEAMTNNRTRCYSRRFPAAGHMIRTLARWIEHLFEIRD